MRGEIILAKKKAYGIFNTSGKDIMSIFEMVERIGKFYGYSTDNLNRISTDTLNQKATRPPKTSLLHQFRLAKTQSPN